MALKIKICGMRDAENILEVATLCPDYLGFIFYSNSPRYVGEGFEAVCDGGIKKVGVFVNATREEVSQTVVKHKLDVVQLHGDETPEFCRLLKDDLSNREIWKSFQLDEQFDFSKLAAYDKVVDKFLFDTKSVGYGGSGQTFNWNKLKEYSGSKEIVLAGGIGPENVSLVKELVKTGIPIAIVDINSKVETSPGIKSKNAISEVMQALGNCD